EGTGDMHLSQKRRLAALLGAALASMPATVRAVSGSWLANVDGSWSDATKWSSSPSFPDGGGTATFGMVPFQSAGHNITPDVSVSLNSIVFNSAYPWTIGGTANSITLTGPATIDVPVSNSSSPSLFAAGDVISRPIAGARGLTKTGAGNLTLTRTN